MKIRFFIYTFIFIGNLFFIPHTYAESDYFTIKTFSPNDFYTFVKVFSEMRGPLRVEILNDKDTNFENADPLKYVEKVKNKRDVKKALKASDMTWDQFRELMGNVLLAYFSIQPQQTKIGLLRQLAGYGLLMEASQIPLEYRPLINEALKTDEGAALASMALEVVLQVPPENTAIVQKKQRDLDRMFYTKYWKDLL